MKKAARKARRELELPKTRKDLSENGGQKNYQTPKIIESVVFESDALKCGELPGDMGCGGGFSA